MNFSDQLYLENNRGYIGYSDRGIHGQNIFLLDLPVLRIKFGTSTAAYVVAKFEDSGGNTLAQWEADNQPTPVYIEFGSVLSQLFAYPSLPVDTITPTFMRMVMTVTAYDNTDTEIDIHTVSWSAWRKSKYDSYNSSASRLWPSLPSRFRMIFNPYEYDSSYNIMGFARRSHNADFAIFNGSANVGSISLNPMCSASFLMKTKRVTQVRATDQGGDTWAVVEAPPCSYGIVALKWFSRVGGCWKSVVLDRVSEAVSVTDTLPVVAEMDEGTLTGGNLSIVARFPNATWRDWLYYSDIVIGEKLTMCVMVPTYLGSYEDVPVDVACSTQPFTERDIRDIEFTITLKKYRIDD